VINVFVSKLTCIDKKLIGESGVIDVVNSCGEDGRHNFQIGKHRLQSNKFIAKLLCVYNI